MDKGSSIVEAYRTEIYRIGWRLQYQSKKVRKHECSYYDGVIGNASFTTQVDTKIMLYELINSLPPKGKLIMYKLYMKGLTEAEISKELNLSQQAVNKWKQKILKQLSQSINL